MLFPVMNRSICLLEHSRFVVDCTYTYIYRNIESRERYRDFFVDKIDSVLRFQTLTLQLYPVVDLK